MDPEPSGSVEEQLKELRGRLLRLEEALGRQGITVESEAAKAAVGQAILTSKLAVEVPAVQPTPAPVAAPPSAPMLARPSAPMAANPAAPMPVRPMFAAHGPASRDIAKDDHSLESRIGSQWFNRIGILAVLIGMAWFLKFAIDNDWIGPLGRVIIGLVAGSGLIWWSERFRAKGYKAFSYSLKALGSGILYLSLWAAFSYFHLIPSGAAFAAMIAVTAFNAYMAWEQDAELLALYAIAGGLSTPLLVSTGENHEIALLSYLLLLDVAVLGLVILKPWSRLLFAAFTGTVLFMLGWWAEFYTPAQAWRTAFFVACFFLIFAFAPRLVRVREPDHGTVGPWDALATVLLPIGAAALGFIGFYSLVETSDADWAGPWLAVAFAAFYLLMHRLPSRGRLRSGPGVLADLHLTAAVVFLTIAIPLKAHGRWLTVGWLVEGAALIWVATRLRSGLIRVLAFLSLTLGLGALLTINPDVSSTPIFNQRFACYCVALAVFAFVFWLARKAHVDEGASETSTWPSIAATAVVIVNVLILIAACLEIHSYWWYLRWHGDWKLMHEYTMYAQFTYSAFLMMFGVVLLSVGFWKRTAFLRWQALALLAFSIGKVFLYDMSELSQGYRILSFLGLGVLLLAVSFAYQKDWLNLRGHKSEAGPDREEAGRTP